MCFRYWMRLTRRSWPPSCPTFTVLSFTVATIHSMSINHQCSSAASLSTQSRGSHHLMILLTLLNAVRRTQTLLKITILPQLWVKLIKGTNNIKKVNRDFRVKLLRQTTNETERGFYKLHFRRRHQWLLFLLHLRLKDDDAQTVLWHLGRTSECCFTLL